MRFDLEFCPGHEVPTTRGDYVLYNQCDGFHLADALFIDDEFIRFQTWMGQEYPADMYCAWAQLPDPIKVLFDAFAEKKPDTAKGT